MGGLIVYLPTSSFAFSGLNKKISAKNQISINSKLEEPEEIYYGSPTLKVAKEMLNAQNVIVYPEDIIRAFPDPRMGLGARIEIFRANPVTVFDGKKKIVYRTWETTVDAFLQEKKISIGDEDKISPKTDVFLEKNAQIKITRVARTNVREESIIKFETKTQDDPNLERGKTKVVQTGENGIREKIYQVIREDGEEISRSLLSDQVAKSPKTEIISRGTKLNFIAYGKASHVGSLYSSGQAAYRGYRGQKMIVKNLTNGREVEVKIIDYGPDASVHSDRIVDLSLADFKYLAPGVSGIISNIGVALIK